MTDDPFDAAIAKALKLSPHAEEHISFCRGDREIKIMTHSRQGKMIAEGAPKEIDGFPVSVTHVGRIRFCSR